MRLSADSLAEMWSSVFRRTRLSPEEATAERLLARQSLGRGAPASQRTLELVLAAAAGPATERELTGEAAAVHAFLAALPEPRRAPRRSQRRVPVLAAGVMIVALVAVAATAEAGALPAPLQQLAHQTINAPAPSPALRGPRPGGAGTRPAPGGSGLDRQTHAGKPSATPKPTHTGASPSDGSGQPSGGPGGQPTGSPSAHPSSSPTDLPSTGDNGQGNGGTPPGQGGTPSPHPTGSGQGQG